MFPAIPAASFDLETVDLEAFLADVRALGKELSADLGDEDLEHLLKIERWGRTATALGWATAWIAPNPFSAAALSLGRSTRWLLMHHVGHRGYDRVPGTPPRLTSKGFARGWRRYLDWSDWMEPEAWKYEHNVLHHSNTGEATDPDLVERNTEALRASMPRWARYGALAALALTWRASYYTQATTRALRAQRERLKPDVRQRPEWVELLLRNYAPYVLLEFVALPLCYAPLGPWAVFSAGCNSLLADLFTNLHTFIVVGPNHSGDDLYRFTRPPANRAERYLRQILGSVNYRTGSDWNDFLHLFLNYQIEHHLWPDLPMRQYQRAQARVRQLCEKHGVPYVQESVWRRVKKLADVVVGRASMRVLPSRQTGRRLAQAQ